jgi:branched-chain amino acid aminotransferase
MKIYIDGKYYDKEEAKISVFDHGLLYGDGIFEGLRIYNGKVFKLREHIARLYESAKAIMLDIGVQKDKMEEIINEAVKVNQKKEGYIRLIVTRGDGPLGVDPFTCTKAKIIIIVGDIQLYPQELYEKGIGIITSSYRRIPAECFDTRIKSLNYLNNIMAKIEARQNNYFESIMLNMQGFVAECTGDNIFIVKNNGVFTPSKYSGALEGITRNTVIEISKNLGLKVEETNLTTFDLYNADECFLTGSGAEIIPVTKIDGRIISGSKAGEITLKIISEFKKIINQ